MHPACGHVCLQGDKPFLVKPALSGEVIEEVNPTARQVWQELAANLGHVMNGFGLSIDSRCQHLGDTR